MNSRTIPRPGGRSARVQAAVHAATRDLIAQIGRTALTVPMIAARAGVTPSTIYRRWGDLSDLLADVALDRMRADIGPLDTGSVLGDLRAWAEQYVEEMTSDLGLSMIRDVLSARSPETVHCQCAALVASQIQVIVDRGMARAEATPAVDAIMDAVVAPIIYRALFGPSLPTRAHVRMLVDDCVGNANRKTAHAHEQEMQ
jgi:AcrR family transcriptional regulator